MSSPRLLKSIPATIVVGIATIVVVMYPQLAELLQYDRDRIIDGEIWRVFSCHLTHWNLEHLQWDLLMFAVLGVFCERWSPRRTWLCLAVGAAAVSATVFLFFPEVSQYRGLSGIDTALFTMLGLELWIEARRAGNRSWSLATGIMLFGFVAKTAYEAVGGATIFVDQEAAGFVPLVWDHIAGAAVGASIALWHPIGAAASRLSFDAAA
jgi:rhomboid family GlyGly-CTERM serine protease